MDADGYGTDVYPPRCNTFDRQQQSNEMKANSISNKAGQHRWSMLLYSGLAAGLAAVVVFLPLLIDDGFLALYLFFFVPALALIGLGSLVYAVIRKDLLIALTVAVFSAVSAVAFLYNAPIRTFTKWSLWSGHYKKEVLAEATPPNGDLKHIEWDGTAFAGIDSTVFLVFDPADSLAAAAQNGQSGKLKGIPCEVGYVRRMESHWYLVFTDIYSWDRCE